jgi:hypothetical protein
MAAAMVLDHSRQLAAYLLADGRAVSGLESRRYCPDSHPADRPITVSSHLAKEHGRYLHWSSDRGLDFTTGRSGPFFATNHAFELRSQPQERQPWRLKHRDRRHNRRTVIGGSRGTGPED